MFVNNIYILNKLIIYEYFLTNDFKFITTSSNYCEKNNTPEFRKIIKFFTKTITMN